MTAPLFHLPPGSLDSAVPGSVLVLDGPEGHHAATVMRMRAGEQIQLSDTQYRRVGGVVLNAESGELSVQVHKVQDDPVPLPRLVLVQALAKEKRDLQAVESATELGVDAIIPWEAERSVAKWKAGREAKKHAEWINTVRTAAKQTRRTSIPEVGALHTTAQYLMYLRNEPRVGVVVLHETEDVSLQEALQDLHLLDSSAQAQAPGPGTGPELIDEHSDPRKQPVPPFQLHLVVGPEGGISDREIADLTASGARIARLGRNVLRSSTAGPAAIAGTQLLLGRWAR